MHSKDSRNLEFSRRVESNTARTTMATVNDRAAFYNTLLATIRILLKKEDYKILEVRVLFEVHLHFACMEKDLVTSRKTRLLRLGERLGSES
jgi:hypothetical protein